MKKNFTVLYSILIILSILIFTSGRSSAQGFLKASGKKIVNGNNQEVYLKGIGLGGWLLHEGYMLQMSSFANAAHEIRQKIVDLIGASNAQEFYKLYYENYVTKADIDKIKSWGFNSIRLPMHYKLLSPQSGVYSEAGFATIDSLLNWCEQNQIYLILDLHAAPGGQSDEPISDYDSNYPSLWEDDANKAHTIELWKKIAERYADKEWIGGYDLINEPKWSLPNNNQALRELYINITNAIRTVDKNHILFVEGNWFANDFTGLTPPWDGNMAYSFHKYWNENNNSSIQSYLNIRNTYNVPLWLGETGENSNAWFVDCVELMKKNNIGWAWWPHKKIDAIAGPLSAVRSADYDKLLNYWKNGGTKPSVDFAANALFEQAKNLALSKCIEHKDVIDALFRQPDNPTVLPFAENEIPGVIFAADYDLGDQSVAYKDNDYQNTGSGDYNSGYSYRNDGVDIEKCSDLYSNGFDVGWINAGEWLRYTVTVKQTGNYKINIRYTATGTGKIMLKMNGADISGFVDLPSTGGWQNWETITLPAVQLTSGSHNFSVFFFSDGFNLNFVEFYKDPTAVNKEENVVKTFLVYQNYPNPFNPSTKIKFEIPKAGNVEVKVYTLLGNEIATLIKEYRNEGVYEVPFNSVDFNLSSGVYFYRVFLNGISSKLMKAVLLK